MPNQDPYIAQELLSHQTFLRRLAIDLVGEDADDLVQEVWQRALERPPHHGRQLRGWLARVARNLAANRWRGEARRAEREERRASERAVGEDLEARFELRKELVEALDSLSQATRETILLRYFEGLAPRDIASRQGTPVATVKTRLRRGLAQLREALDKRHDGDRRAWMSGVTALAVPAGSGVGTGTLVIGGMAMGTTMKVSAAILVVAAGVYFATRAPQTESPRMAVVETPEDGEELAGPTLVSAAEGPVTEAVRRVAEEPPGGVSAVAGTNVLRVVLEGITEEDAGMTTVTLTGVDESGKWPAELLASWPCQGATSELDLDPFLASVERYEDLRVDELEVEVDHPHHLSERTRVPMSRGVELKSGQTVHEVRVQLARPVFWPEITLNVRDARTRVHLRDVEIRSAPSGIMGLWRRPGSNEQHYSPIGEGLRSPIALLGGYASDDPEAWGAGLALSPAAGEAPRFIEMWGGREPFVYARAPGYAWDRIKVDISSGDEYELLLGPEAMLTVHLANVQLERYAAIEMKAKVGVHRIFPNGNGGYVWFQDIDETLVAEGLRLDGLEPGNYAVVVELGDRWSRSKQPVLAREELSLAVGEPHELVLHLDDAPEQKRPSATLAGVVSFPPIPRGYEWVRLDLYEVRNAPVSMLGLADMERTDDTPHTWSFRVEDLPVGLYQFVLRPFLVSWMVELPPGGREDLELVIPELAEVLVETVDARTGERVPLDSITFGLPDLLPDQIQTYQQTGVDFEGEPGRFRFGTTPGAAFIQTHEIPSGHDYGRRRMDLELVPGTQSVRLELGPRYAIRFELRENGKAPTPGGDIYWGSIPSVRAVEHGGHVTHEGSTGNRVMEVSAPGVYEVGFEGVTAHRFQSIAPRLVDVRAGETTEVIVELHRK